MDSRFFALNRFSAPMDHVCYGLGCEKCKSNEKRKKAKVISLVDRDTLPLENPMGTLSIFQRGPIF